jgi:hypothetical protein
MGAINTSRSNIKNTSRTASGTEVGAEVVIEVTETDGQVAATVQFTIKINGKSETHEFRVDGTREVTPRK